MVPAPIEQCANFKVFEEEACPLKCCVVPTGNYFHETSDISDFIPLFDLALECSKILRNYKISRHDDPSQKPFKKSPKILWENTYSDEYLFAPIPFKFSISLKE